MCAPRVLSWVLLWFCLAAGFSACAREKGQPFFKDNYDVLLEVSPIKVKEFQIDSPVDVIEKEPDQMYLADAVVMFKINKVVRGEFTKLKRGGPSELDQMRDAVKQGKVFKLLTMDFQNPDEEYEKEWLMVAVDRVEEKFGITSWDAPGNDVFRLYLRKIPKYPDSYILVKSEKKTPKGSVQT